MAKVMQSPIDVLISQRDALLSQLNGSAARSKLAEIETQIANAEADAKAAGDARRKAMLSELRQAEFTHEKKVLSALTSLVAEIEAARETGVQLIACGATEHCRYPAVLMQMPQALEAYKKRLAAKSPYAEQKSITD